MSEISTKILKLINEKDLSYGELSKRTKIPKSALQRYATGDTPKIPLERLEIIANALNVTPAYLMGWEENDSAPDSKEPVDSEITVINNVKFYKRPVYNSAAAGFGAFTDDKIVDYELLPFETEGEANHSILINVKGDSMEPKIEDGDRVVVWTDAIVDSGNIAVVYVDRNEGVVKKVKFDSSKKWIELHSLNPQYPVRRFEGSDLERISIFGKVTKVIKKI